MKEKHKKNTKLLFSFECDIAATLKLHIQHMISDMNNKVFCVSLCFFCFVFIFY